MLDVSIGAPVGDLSSSAAGHDRGVDSTVRIAANRITVADSKRDISQAECGQRAIGCHRHSDR